MSLLMQSLPHGQVVHGPLDALCHPSSCMLPCLVQKYALDWMGCHWVLVQSGSMFIQGASPIKLPFPSIDLGAFHSMLCCPASDLVSVMQCD